MKDLTVNLDDRPGTLADAFEALGRAGVDVEGACGFPAGGQGVLHILVEDDMDARWSLEKAGIDVQGERDVVLLEPLPDRPGAAGAALRRVADQGVNVDLLYLTVDGRIVLSGGDVLAIERAAGDLVKPFDESP